MNQIFSDWKQYNTNSRPGDPQSSIVEFRAESMKELKRQLQRYKDPYRRWRYDY